MKTFTQAHTHPRCQAAIVDSSPRVHCLRPRRQPFALPGRHSWQLRAAAGNSIPVVHPAVIIPPPSKGSQYGSGDDSGNKNGGGGGSGGGSPGSGSEGDPSPRARFIRSAMIAFLIKLSLYCAWTLGIYFVLRFIFGVFGVVGYCLGLLLGGVKGLVLRMTDDGSGARIVVPDMEESLAAKGASGAGFSQEGREDSLGGRAPHTEEVHKVLDGDKVLAGDNALEGAKNIGGDKGYSGAKALEGDAALQGDQVVGGGEALGGDKALNGENVFEGDKGLDVGGESISDKKVNPAFERRPASASDAIVVYFTLMGSLLFFVLFPGL